MQCNKQCTVFMTYPNGAPYLQFSSEEECLFEVACDLKYKLSRKPTEKP